MKHCYKCGKNKDELKEKPIGTRLENGKWGIICRPCRNLEVLERIRKVGK